METAELELVHRARRGDAEAFREIVEMHSRTLWRAAYRVLEDATAAEDAVQSTFLSAWRALDRFDDRAQLSTWLYRIVMNAAIDLKRQRTRRQAMAGALPENARGEVTVASPEADPHRQAVWRQLAKSKLLRDLSAEQLKLLFQGVVVVYFDPGQTVVDRGSRDEALFIIVGGEVLASIVDHAGAAIDVRSFGAGQVIGEGSLFEHKAWPATYKAKTKVSLLRLTQAGLEICLKGNPDPRGFLDVLRRDQLDRDVSQSVARLESGTAAG